MTVYSRSQFHVTVWTSILALTFALTGWAGDECGGDDPRVGYEAALSPRAHDVSGTARIVDNCTIVIEDFNYDGGGIVVEVYGFQDLEFTSGVSLSGNLLRDEPYVNETLMVPLPDGVTLDDVPVISIWCVAVSMSFGEGAFGPVGDDDACDIFPASDALDTFYADFGLTGGPEFDPVGLGMPLHYNLALAEQTCIEEDAGRLLALRTAYTRNVEALDALAPGTSLDGNVDIAAFLAAVSEALADVVTAALTGDGIDTNGLALLYVECDAVGCTPLPDAKDDAVTHVFEKGSAELQPYSEAGDYDGDDVTNLTEVTNVMARGGGLSEFVAAATDPALDGTVEPAGGCLGAGNAPAGSVPGLVPLALTCLLLLRSRKVSSPGIR